MNTDVQHGGATLHVQTQDRGVEKPVIETLVYSGGEIVAAMIEPYDDLLAAGGDVEAAVRARMRARHASCVELLRQGRLRRLEQDIRAIERVAVKGVVQQLDERLSEAVRRRRRRGPLRQRPGPRRAAAVLGAAVLVVVGLLSLRAWKPEELRPSLPPSPPAPEATRPLAGESAPAITHVLPPLDPSPLPPSVSVRLETVDVPPFAPPTPLPQKTVPPTVGESTPSSAPPAVAASTSEVAAPPAPPKPGPATRLGAPSGAASEPVERPSVASPPASPGAEPPAAAPREPVAAAPAVAGPPIDWTGKLVAYSEVDMPPRAARRELPRYTRRARKRQDSGTVRLELLIDETGQVADVRFVAGIAGSDLNDAAVRSARNWTYHPATREGRPVRVWKPVELEFYLAPGKLDVVRIVEDALMDRR